jgi:hypothetical protein
MRNVRCLGVVANARFWIWTNTGWVKLTLRPEQELSWTYGGNTDEGYSYSAEKYTHCGDRVVSESSTEARDCDGRMDHHSVCECPLDHLRARDMGAEQPDYPENAGIFAPEWQRVSAGQRDYAAEAMGY